jgi:hypothetical protein
MVTWTWTEPNRVATLLPLKVPLMAAFDDDPGLPLPVPELPVPEVPDPVPEVPEPVPELPVPELPDPAPEESVPPRFPDPVPELPPSDAPPEPPALMFGETARDVPCPVPACQPSRMIPADAADAMMIARALTS